MSLKEKLKEKFSTESQFKAQLIKFAQPKIPRAIESLEEFLDNLFLQIAESNKENPFGLFLVVSVKKVAQDDQVLVGEVYNAEKKKLAAVNVGEIIEEMVLSQKEKLPIPAFIKTAVDESLESLDVSIPQLMVNELGTKRLVVKYNKNSDLIYIEMDGKKKQSVKLEQTINKAISTI